MSKNILVIYAHPSPHLSRVNRRLADAARAIPGVQVHDLYQTYPDFYIDVAREQALLAEADLIVFLHPIQWYSMPALLKEWVDEVFQHSWACGKDTQALRGKAFLLAVTTGSAAESYDAGGAHGRPFADFLPPFEQTAALCGMNWQRPHILHGAHLAREDVVEAHVQEFAARLADFSNNPDLQD